MTDAKADEAGMSRDMSRDPEVVSRFVEHFAAQLVEAGIPRMPARVFATAADHPTPDGLFARIKGAFGVHDKWRGRFESVYRGGRRSKSSPLPTLHPGESGPAIGIGVEDGEKLGWANQAHALVTWHASPEPPIAGDEIVSASRDGRREHQIVFRVRGYAGDAHGDCRERGVLRHGGQITADRGSRNAARGGPGSRIPS